mgnify:CR=1 FL=1
MKNIEETTQKGEKGQIRLLINPPPQDGSCEVCGRTANELKPYGKEGDPLVGGALLIKSFRCHLRNTENEYVDASWECRDCIILNDEDYAKKKEENMTKNKR